jgi:hypothetical protein
MLPTNRDGGFGGDCAPATLTTIAAAIAATATAAAIRLNDLKSLMKRPSFYVN